MILAITGCASWSTSSVDTKAVSTSVGTTATATKTPVAAIKITDTDVVDKKYESLGDVTVNLNKTTIFNAEPTQAMVNEKLKEKAFEMGADAVILVRYGQGGISLFSWGSLEGKGRAIRYVR